MERPLGIELIRTVSYDEPTRIRAKKKDDDDGEGNGNILYGHFSVFNRWTEIDSWLEGHFMERIAPGAHKEDFKTRGDQIKPIFHHGMDAQLGYKPLGPVRTLKEDDIGGYYEVPLIDTDYNRNFIKPAAAAGTLGASFRFSTLEESWNEEPGVSKHNPKGIPEVTRTRLRTVEFGPTPFGAYPEATTALRSISPNMVEELASAVVEQLRSEGLIASGKSHVDNSDIQKHLLPAIAETVSSSRHKLVRQIEIDKLLESH